MKKLLLCMLVALCLPMATTARDKALHRIPAGMDLLENQRIMGHYTSDAISTDGVKLNVTGKTYVGVILDSEELDVFTGGDIVAFRVGLADSTTVSKVFLIPITAGGAYGTMITWPCEASEIGWNTIELPSPYQIIVPEDGRLMIGFEYDQTSTNKPLALVNEGDIYDTYQYKKAGSMYRWAVAGLRPYGNLCVQCVVEKDQFPDVLIRAKNLEAPAYMNVGEQLPFSFTVKNIGTSVIESQALTFDVKIDGEKVMTISNPEALEAGSINTLQGVVGTDEMASGNHTLTIDNAVVSEGTLNYVYPMNVDFMLYSGVYPRQKHMVEQLTSTYCTYCPLGNSMLSILTGMRDDVVWVGLHGNLGSGVDPFRSDQCDSIMAYLAGNSISYPSAAFDRFGGWENPNVIVNSIGYYEQYHQQIAEELSAFFDYVTDQNPAFASISIDPVVNLETREAVITVSGEMTSDFETLLGNDNKLTVYLTEDSLVARQLNNGAWVSLYVHNGVFRQALCSVKGVDINRTEDGYSNEFTVTIPDAWNINHLNVVAFIGRPITNGVERKYTDMYINNAESVRLVSETGGIEEILTDEDAIPVGYYDVMGRQIDGPRQGINIVKMSNGTAKKVLIR